MATKTLTVKEVAEMIGTDGRTLRKFLRHEVTEAGGKVGEDTPGKGGRYSLESTKVKQLQKRFDAWNESRRSKPEAETDEETSSEVEVELD